MGHRLEYTNLPPADARRRFRIATPTDIGCLIALLTVTALGILAWLVFWTHVDTWMK